MRIDLAITQSTSTWKQGMYRQNVLTPRVRPQQHPATTPDSRRAHDDELTQRLTEIQKRDQEFYESQLRAMAVRQRELETLLRHYSTPATKITLENPDDDIYPLYGTLGASYTHNNA